MRFRNHWWLLVPLAAALGCAGSQQAQKETKAGGKATLVDEGPASASAQNAPTTAQAGAAGAAAGATAAGQAVGGQLVPFHGKNGFVVLMPANPQQEDRVQDTPGGPVKVHVAQAQDPAGKYMTSLSEFPKGSLDRIKSKDLLGSLQQATIQAMGGTLVNSHDVDASGLPGREFTATDPQGSEVTARVFVGDSRVYTLAGTYAQGQQIPGSIQQFLGSFQPPAGTAVGGSGASGGTGDAMGGASSDSSATTVPAEPSTNSKKRSRRSTSSSSSTTESTSGSSAGSSGGR